MDPKTELESLDRKDEPHGDVDNTTRALYDIAQAIRSLARAVRGERGAAQ